MTAVVPTTTMTTTNVNPSFSSSLTWSPKYTRTRHRNVRCFPCCLPQHKSRSFCGRSIPVHFTVPAADESGKSISEGRVQCMEVYCCFRSMRLPIWLNVGQLCSEESKDQHQEDLVVASFVSFDPDTRRAIFEARPPRKWQYTFQRHAPTSLYSDALDNDWHAFSAFVVDTETQKCWGQCDSPAFRIISSWKIVVPKSSSTSSTSTTASKKTTTRKAGFKRPYSTSGAPDGGRGLKKERIGSGGAQSALMYSQGFHPQQQQQQHMQQMINPNQYNNMMMSPNMYPLQHQQQHPFYAPQGGYMGPGMYGGGMPNMMNGHMGGNGNNPNMYAPSANSPNNMFAPASTSTPSMYAPHGNNNPNMYAPNSTQNPNIYPTSSMPMWMPTNNAPGMLPFSHMPSTSSATAAAAAVAATAPLIPSPAALSTPSASADMQPVPMPMPMLNTSAPISLSSSLPLFNYNNNTYTLSTPGPADTNFASMAGMSHVNPNKPVMPMLMPTSPEVQKPKAVTSQQQTLSHVLAPQHQPNKVLTPQPQQQKQAHVAAVSSAKALLVKAPEPKVAVVGVESPNGSGCENVKVAAELDKTESPSTSTRVSSGATGANALSIMANAAALQVELERAN